MKTILLISCLICVSINVKGQAFNAGTHFSGYTDIIPDTLLNYTAYPYTNETFSINIFGNASYDIAFTAHGAVSPGGSGLYINIKSLNPDVFVRFGRWDSVYIPAYSFWDVTKVAKPLNAGEQINTANVVWDTTLLYITDRSGYGGGNKNVNDWLGGDKFVGLQYRHGGSSDYGWIRIKCNSPDSCYVKDFSYTSVNTGISKIAQKEILSYPNPVYSNFNIEGIDPFLFEISRLILTDGYGTKVKFSTEIQNNSIKIGLEKSLPQGCYFLQYFSDDAVLLKKVVKISE